jgi:hypothetical protein
MPQWYCLWQESQVAEQNISRHETDAPFVRAKSVVEAAFGASRDRLRGDIGRGVESDLDHVRLPAMGDAVESVARPSFVKGGEELGAGFGREGFALRPTGPRIGEAVDEVAAGLFHRGRRSMACCAPMTQGHGRRKRRADGQHKGKWAARRLRRMAARTGLSRPTEEVWAED